MHCNLGSWFYFKSFISCNNERSPSENMGYLGCSDTLAICNIIVCIHSVPSLWFLGSRTAFYLAAHFPNFICENNFITLFNISITSFGNTKCFHIFRICKYLFSFQHSLSCPRHMTVTVWGTFFLELMPV